MEDLRIEGVDCVVRLRGKPFAAGISNTPGSLPARQTRVFHLLLYAPWSTSPLVSLPERPYHTVPYDVEGRIHPSSKRVEHGVALFRSAGEIELAPLLTPTRPSWTGESEQPAAGAPRQDQRRNEQTDGPVVRQRK